MTVLTRRPARRSISNTVSPSNSLSDRAGVTPRPLQLRDEVQKHLVAAGYQITAQRRMPNNLAWQLRLATGQVVNIYNTGSVVVQGVGSEPAKRLLQRVMPAKSTQGECNSASARAAPDLPPPAKRPPLRPARRESAESCVDSDGYPIRLLGTDVVLAMGPPPLPPKAWDNPKTLRHMENRLRALGYRIRSMNWFGPQWRIKLETGQTIYYEEGGKITLGPFERDRRLEYLFEIKGPSDQVAHSLT